MCFVCESEADEHGGVDSQKFCVCRLLGYIRDILIAIFLGASVYADAFFVAFRLPNTFRRLFAEGTFNAAFIPSYTSERVKSKKSAKKFADDVLAFVNDFLSGLT